VTALTKYARLEASALWRASPDEQRREVIISIGDATLMISDLRDRAITHWSLAAVQRANPGQRPAIFYPYGDPGETLELAADEGQMIDAIERLRRAVERTRPRPGRLRWLGTALTLTVVAALAVFWLPGALISHTVSVVPQVKRSEIGAALLTRIERVTGPACADPGGERSLQKLRARLGSGPLRIMPGTVSTSLHLPGGFILLDRALVEDFEDAEVAAGYILQERTLARQTDPLDEMLQAVGMRASFHLLTTGSLRQKTMDRYAEYLLKAPRSLPPDAPLLAAFEERAVRSKPYALARDVSGESVLAFIEADQINADDARPLLSDADWLRLQAICGG
jgi:hypothetical protein